MFWLVYDLREIENLSEVYWIMVIISSTRSHEVWIKA